MWRASGARVAVSGITDSSQLSLQVVYLEPDMGLIGNGNPSCNALGPICAVKVTPPHHFEKMQSAVHNVIHTYLKLHDVASQFPTSQYATTNMA